MLLIGLQTPAQAGFYESSYFEPTLGCAFGAAVGYSSTKENQAMNAAMYCAAGLVLGIVTNSYYRKKVDAVHEREVSEKQNLITRKKVELARRATLGDTSQRYSIQAEQIEDAQLTPNGEVISPSKRVLLDTP